jgi:2-keto-4-pentenoate hydratase/2-oxohepta-3-ene-1,7-dioic acid hydratase in catechol pathway
MKLLSFNNGARDTWGALAGDGGVVDLGGHFGAAMPTLRACLEGGDAAMKKVARYMKGRKGELSAKRVRYLPTITNPDKVICVGLNYRKHAMETGSTLPDHPMLFARFTDSHVGHGQPILRPKESKEFDYEGELTIIIGKPCRRVSKSRALDYVAGYSIYNDGSIRDWQRHTSQVLPGKNYHKTGSFGPWMTTADEIPDPSKLHLTTRLNGKVVQDEGVDDLIFDCRELISYCSSIMELVPGDTIVTGTPSGVGIARKPQLWMKPGDTIEVEISGIGVLRNPIRAG